MRHFIRIIICTTSSSNNLVLMLMLIGFILRSYRHIWCLADSPLLVKLRTQAISDLCNQEFIMHSLFLNWYYWGAQACIYTVSHWVPLHSCNDCIDWRDALSNHCSSSCVFPSRHFNKSRKCQLARKTSMHFDRHSGHGLFGFFFQKSHGQKYHIQKV